MLLSRRGCVERQTLGKLCSSNIVKINKKKLYLNWSSEGLWGSTLYTLPLVINYPKQEETYFPFQQEDAFLLYYPNRKKDNLLFTQQPLSQRKTIKQIPNFLQWTTSLQQPLNSPFLYKECLLFAIKQHIVPE